MIKAKSISPLFFILFLFIILLSLYVNPIGKKGADSRITAEQEVADKAAKAYGKLPLYFEANHGQSDPQVKFLSRGPGYALFLTNAETVLALKKPLAGADDSSVISRVLSMRSGGKQKIIDGKVSKEAVLKMNLVGSNPNPKIAGLEKLPGKSHYLSGNNPEKWHTDVPRYARVKYEEVYPGIDLIYYGNQQQLEYDLVVAPGADPNIIRIGFKGADSLRLDEKGNLILQTKGGEVLQHTPRIYQEVSGSMKPVTGSYVLLNPEQETKKQNSKSKTSIIGFQVAAYDTTQPLIIDPVLTYSTYLGGANSPYGNNIYGWDIGMGIAVDASGNAYVTGETWSTDFPTANSYQAASGGDWDVFVAKLSADGSSLLYSTYLGGSGDDRGIRIDVDNAGNAYAAGATSSTNFPTVNPIQGANGGGAFDVFVTKINAAGSALFYSTFLGGAGGDRGVGIAVDKNSGEVYVTGRTDSVNFPTTNGAFDTSCGTDGSCNGGFLDGFAAKINSSGSSLVYSTYLGGSGEDRGVGIAVDSSGNAYVVGRTASSDFPTSDPIQGTYGGGDFDAFVTKINAAGNNLVYSTYLGGSAADADPLGYGIPSEEIQSVAVDASGNAYVIGYTWSTDFPTANAYQSIKAGDWDAFVAKISPTGGGNVSPTVTLSANTTSGNTPLAVNFTANASDTDGSITQYEWDLDGNGAYEAANTNSTSTYTYNSAGTYSAHVRVTDNGGATATSAVTITVNSSSSGGGSGSGGDSGGGSSGGGGCGFVKDNNGRGQGAKGEGLSFAVMLVIALSGIALAKRAKRLIKA
ncbi:MAG: SBBP repeat-containing protein [Nitrospirota bacterium]